MRYKPKVVLQTPVSSAAALADFVEDCLRDGVELIAVCGEGCEDVHDLIDDLIVGDGSEEKRFIATSWHTGELLDEVLDFADICGAGGSGAVQVVTL